MTVSRGEETKLLTKLTWGAWRPRESMIIPKDWLRRSDHPAELLFITLGVESTTRLASQNDVRHGKYVAQVQKQARRKGGDGVPPGGDVSLTFCAAIREARLIQEDDAVVVVDCRLPHDPHEDLHARDHSGTLPEIIAGFVHNVGFKSWLRETLRKVESGIEAVVVPPGGDGVPPGGDGVPPGGNFSRLVVAFFCKRGHHRSVAGATVFAHVLQATSDSWYPMAHDHTPARTAVGRQLWDVTVTWDGSVRLGR